MSEHVGTPSQALIFPDLGLLKTASQMKNGRGFVVIGGIVSQGAVDVLRVTRCQHEVELGMSKNLLSIRCIELFLNNVLIF